jgi:uncharacterized hydrophobic protein (TIGR00271 family)
MNKFSELFNLSIGEDNKFKTLENVKSNITFNGANLWILVCAILIASVGLNVNSTAVVIGAMLISPLMGPIVGSGFALGIYDFELLKKSLINLAIATIAGLTVSTIYFYLSPFKDVQSEILSRTSPNIYDVLIAFFGGLVGVIAITRVEKGNPIPGVAIATALMPPLCTAGYGLATGNLRFLFGALFLYTINCVFICISTYIIVKYLKYPAITSLDKKREKQVKYSIIFILLLMILPSSYFAYSLYKKQQYKQEIERFVNNEITNKGTTIFYQKTKFNVKGNTLELSFLNKVYSKSEIESLNNKLKDYGIKNTSIKIIQTSADNMNALKDDILNEVTKNGVVLDEKDKQIQQLRNEIAKNTFNNKQLFEEIKLLFPNIIETSIANHNFIKNDSLFSKTVLIYQSNPKFDKENELKLKNWAQKRLELTDLEIINKP